MKPQFMYVIGPSQDGPVKLGISGDPDRRRRALQTGHAAKLQLFHTEQVPQEKARLFERLLHRDIGYLRTMGEWFNLTVEQAVAHIRFTIIRYDGVDDLARQLRLRRV